MTLIQKMNPINKEEEKKKFLFDTDYNPQFLYHERIDAKEIERFGEITSQYLVQAEKILDIVLKTFGTETIFLHQAEGDVIGKQELITKTEDYIQRSGLEGKIDIRFSPHFMSPASMTGNVISFRLPVSQRSKRLEGTLNHEIGTHFFRRINDEKQPWHKKRNQFELAYHLETEEGLAVLHSHLLLEHKHLWFTALYYTAVYYASKMSFSQLFAHLKRYVDDKDRRFHVALRAKRGMTDTSLPGAIAKDQVYLRGVIKVLRYLEKHDYDPSRLYIGKIDLEDEVKAFYISPNYQPILPLFLQPEQKASYKEAIKAIRKQNGL